MNCERDAIKRFLRDQNIATPLTDASLLRILSSLSSAHVSTLDIPALLGVSAEDITAASASAVAPWWQDEQLTPKAKTRPSVSLRQAKTKGKQQTSDAGRSPANDKTVVKKRSTKKAANGGEGGEAVAVDVDIWTKYNIEERPWRGHMQKNPKPPQPEEKKTIWEKYRIEERPWKAKMKTKKTKKKEETPPDRKTQRESRPRPWKRCMKLAVSNTAEDDTPPPIPEEELDRATRRKQRSRPWLEHMKPAAPKEPEPEPDRRTIRETRPTPWRKNMTKTRKKKKQASSPDRKAIRENRPRPWRASPFFETLKELDGSATNDSVPAKKEATLPDETVRALADVSLDSASNSSPTAAEDKKNPLKIVAAAEATNDTTANAPQETGTASRDDDDDDYHFFNIEICLELK